jgi:DNA-binding response OmpR family regulator
MLNILLVEDEPLLASTVKAWIESNPFHQVIAVVDDLPSALAAAEQRLPHVAIVDLTLTDGRSGLEIIKALSAMGVECLITSGDPPSAALPGLAVGCLVKPYSYDELVRALRLAEDAVRGREAVLSKPPANFQPYSQDP